MNQEQIDALAQEAINLHTDARSHMVFRLSLERSIAQVVDEQDVLDVDTIGQVVEHRDTLIAEVTAAVASLQAERDS